MPFSYSGVYNFRGYLCFREDASGVVGDLDCYLPRAYLQRVTKVTYTLMSPVSQYFKFE